MFPPKTAYIDLQLATRKYVQAVRYKYPAVELGGVEEYWPTLFKGGYHGDVTYSCVHAWVPCNHYIPIFASAFPEASTCINPVKLFLTFAIWDLVTCEDKVPGPESGWTH